MNGGARKFAVLAAASLLAVSVGACMNDPTTASTPISQQIAAAVAAPAAEPSFANVPVAPTDVRAPAAWRRAVGEEERARDQLLRDSAPETFALKGDTEAFAERSRNEATRNAPAVPTEADRAATEAYAARARAQASPPSSTR